MLAGEQPTIYGDGEQSRDFTYIDNVVAANLLAAAAPAEKVSGRMMNVATGTAITLNQTFEILCGLTGYRGKPAYAEPRSGDIRDSLADIRLAGELLGYAPSVDFREGLRRTVEWYRTSKPTVLTRRPKPLSRVWVRIVTTSIDESRVMEETVWVFLRISFSF